MALRQREGWPTGKGEVPKPRSISGSLKRLAELQDGNGKLDSQVANNE